MHSEKEARDFLSQAREAGFADAFLIGDYNGRAISLAQVHDIEDQLIGSDTATSEE
jgi:hypothetical protein